MDIDIQTFLDLREAGYSVAQIKEYAASLTPAPAPAPAPAPVPAPQPAPAPQTDPPLTPDNTDLLQAILNAVQNRNINSSNLPDNSRNADQILAEIINPPKKSK